MLTCSLRLCFSLGRLSFLFYCTKIKFFLSSSFFSQAGFYFSYSFYCFTYMICAKSSALLLYLLKNNYRLMCIHIIMGGVGGTLTGLPEKVCRYSGLFLLKTNSTSTSRGRECQAVSSMIINVSSYFIKYARLSTVD